MFTVLGDSVHDKVQGIKQSVFTNEPRLYTTVKIYLFSHKNNIIENKNKNDNKLTHPTEISNVMQRNEKQDITPYVNET